MPKVGLIGSPITDSLSPLLHRTLFALTGVQATYEPWEFPPSAFPGDFVQQVKRDWVGLNVTTPYKEQAYALSEFYSEAPMILGAVNHLWVRPDGVLVGDNKDVDGVYFTLQGIQAANPQRPPDWLQELHVLGFGPAARATILAAGRYWRAERQRLIVHAKRDPGPARIRVYVRSHQPGAEAAADRLREALPDTIELTLEPWVSLGADQVAGLLINATTVKLESPLLALPAGDYGVLDLNYGASPPALVTLAKAAGRYALDGLPMLVWQGFFSAARWFPDKIKPQQHMGLAKRLLDTLRKELVDAGSIP